MCGHGHPSRMPAAVPSIRCLCHDMCMSKRFLLRDALTQFPPYKPGKPPSDAPGLAPYKLSSNENHFAPLPGITEAVAAATQVPAAYPDPKSAKLVAEIAAYLDVDPSEVVPGAGASEILSALTNITLEAGTSVVYPWPSFEMYPQTTGLAGSTRIEVPLRSDGTHDLAAMAAAITEATSLIILCSPNNPTGPVLRDAEVREFLTAVPDHVVVALDEAYWEFANTPGAVDGLELVADHPNVVLLRTFSKAHGLAGLRVGYGVGHPSVIAGLLKAVIPFGVTDLGQAAALESLRHWDEVIDRARQIATIRDGFAAGLRTQGWEVPEAQGNFVWLPLGERTEEFAGVAKDAGLVVRPFAGEGVRATIAEPEANDRLVDVVKGFVGTR